MKDFNSQEIFISKLKENVNSNRSSLVGEKFNIISMMGEVKYEVEVKKLIGEGGSSMVYEVLVNDSYPPLKKMIMKEFYPNYNEEEIVAERNPINRLELYFDAENSQDEQRVKKDRDKFIDAYNKHIRILEMDPYLEGKIVRPYRVEIDNSYLYSLYEVDTATSVDKYYNLDLARIVDILIQTSDILIHLHNNDIIYMDLKPANILYDYNNSKVKLFDFDAAIDLNELEYVNEFSMPNEKSFIPPEIRYISDINKRKDIFITEEIDIYMLGVTFFSLLMGRYPTDQENEDMDLLERNIRDVLNNKSNKILINKIAEDGIVKILQETLSIHRYIRLDELKSKLQEVERNLRFRNNEEFASIISAAYFLDYNRLYNYIVKRDGSKNIDVAIVGNNNISKTFFSFIFAAVNLKDVNLNITFYDKNPNKFYQELICENPLLTETAVISVNGKVKINKINEEITDIAYANIDFKSSKERIDQSYILILDKTGYEYYHMADGLYHEFKNDPQKRIILNYSRNNHEVDIRQEGNISFYNLDLASTSTYRNREFSDKILDEAFEIFRLYVLNSFGERSDNFNAWKYFIKDDFYNLKSSLRVALSIEYYKFMVGVESAADPADKFYKEVVNIEDDKGINTRDILADYEHQSWNRFLIVLGYKVPSRKELRSYAYIDKKGYIDFQNKYNPFIANCNIGLIKNGELDQMSKISIYIEELIREKTIYKEEQIKSKLLNILYNTFWDDNIYLQKLRPYWRELVTIANNIFQDEAYSHNSLNVLTYEIERILAQSEPELTLLSSDYQQIKDDLILIIKRNQSLNIRSMDYIIIDSIPLIGSERVKTIFKPFIDDDENLWANIIAAIKFYPEKLVFLSDTPVDDGKINRIRDFLIKKRLKIFLQIEVISYEQLALYSRENAIVDLTLNSHVDGKREEINGLPYVEYTGFNQWFGNYKALDYYFTKSSLSVDETFFLNNAQIHDNGSLSSITRLRDYYPSIWKTYMKLRSDDWDDFAKAIKYSENYYLLNLDDYEKTDNNSLIEVGDFKFRSYDDKKYVSLKNFLDKMISEGILYQYQFPPNPGKLRLHSYNDQMSSKIGDFISENMWDYNEGFDLIKTEQADNNYKKSYTIFSDKLCFAYEYEAENSKEFAEKIKAIMADIDSNNDGTYTRIFNQIDGKEYAKDLKGKVLLNYEYGDPAFREYFSRKGSLLRVYTYFELINDREFFDDIKLRVNLRWKAYDDYRQDSLPIENVLDIVCTKGFSTIIISTVEGNIKNEDLYEINNYTKQFGMDAKPVLVTSNSDDDTSQIKMIAAAAGVYFIDRQMLKENGVADYIKNIALGKKDWKNIEDK